jgi:broad specificity phosphatase PhoE
MDVPLDDIGLRQAHHVAQRFSGKAIHAVYSSPLLRAADTARAIAQACNREVIFDDRLREYHMGDWTGLIGDEISVVTPGLRLDAPEVAIPNGESAQDMHNRVESFLHDAILRHANETLILVSHGGTLGAMVGAMLGLPVTRRHPFAFGNTAIAKTSYEHNRWRLRSLNDRCHLREV